MFELIGRAMTADMFPLLAITAALAGLVRGFSGFGSAMILVPVASALTSPQTAVVLLLLTDTLLTVPMVVPAVKRCVWREVLPLAAGAMLTVPLGVHLLIVLDPIVMRWIISTLILVLVALLLSGWRWSRPPSLPRTAVVGGASGLTGGMAGIAGPPVILFWMAGHGGPATIRANIIVFFAMTGLFNLVAYILNGLLTSERVALGIALIPVYALALLIGARLFRFASERFFRLLAFSLCAFAALSGLPLLD
ncbi:sulfite exporter TauE/SafE family protein [Aquibaculum arenosum]|uniref:Probable membrane transporter protein n=1 Tax=Aquibaculum arenosum TaxID=3032591 RepID=A0ABT5YJ45_9PROT|nr:sulfite exporter TauE/SafE family protein [Fodinicurvata sp. CAU 1616]MDF2094971.1 sulfite exporter TauE/SafE family protein [Fodinicurvata sp. CAU 1616]